MTITLRMAIPQGVSTSGLKILHVHSVNDMEYEVNVMDTEIKIRVGGGILQNISRRWE